LQENLIQPVLNHLRRQTPEPAIFTSLPVLEHTGADMQVAAQIRSGEFQLFFFVVRPNAFPSISANSAISPATCRSAILRRTTA
jgi:hypothetical protein